MNINGCQVKVLIKGRSITEFYHRGQTFIEGRGGSEYEIEFRNQNPFRVEAILSVDGLSVTDGKVAGEHSTGYIVEANSSLRVPGWTLDNAQVAVFAFGTERGGSYVEQTTGSAVNKGVLGALVYKEKSVFVPHYYPQYVNTMAPTKHYKGYPNEKLSAKARGIACSASNDSYSDSYRGIAPTAAPFIGVQTIDQSYIASNSGGGMDGIAVAAASEVEQTLGTMFGHATDFRTTQVTFTRGDLVAMIVVYYDDAAGLKKRGIVMSRRRPKTQPQAFPGMNIGCTPPENWDG